MNKFLILFFFYLISGFEIKDRKEALQSSNNFNVEKIDKQKLEKLIKNRNGKILFLNLWATWCVPCREEFPSIVKLSKEYKDVEFVGISVDFPEEVESKIKPFLKNNGAGFLNFVNAFESDEELINLLNENWNGALPATFIYDKKGKQIFFLEGKKTYEEFKKFIEKARK